MSDLRCGARLRGRSPCMAEPMTAVLVGCVHEHVFESVACPSHIKGMRGGDVSCAKCRKSTEPHECTLHLLRVGDETVPQRAAS